PINISSDYKWSPSAATVAGNSECGPDLARLHRPSSVCIDDRGGIFVADQHNHRIVKWMPHGQRGKLVGTGKGIGNGQMELNCPTDVIFDSETDSLIISDYGHKRVVQCSFGNNECMTTVIQDIKCRELAMDYQRRLYVTNEENHEVKQFVLVQKSDKIKAKDNGKVVAGGHGQGNGLNQLNHPQCVFVDEYLQVYVSDSDNHRVMKWKEDAQVGEVVAGGNGEGSALTQLKIPSGLFVDSLGNLYVVDNGNERVMRWCRGMSSVSVVAGGNGPG
ncbi:unnamed protein product, partial [Rotaria sp. Silwood2]